MKVIIYEVLTRLWGRGKFSDWDSKAFAYLHTLGVDYIWFTGIPMHASGKDFVKGNPGSMYSVSDWMDVNPYLADSPDDRMKEFSALVSRTHEEGFKFMMDYIPNHVARDYRGGIVHYDTYDGDWTDTLKNDWTSVKTMQAMHEILRFWALKGVDGFRCDMVEMVPQEALRQLISEIKSEFPGIIFVAEAYDMGNYRKLAGEVGFDYVYDKSGFYDTLRNICCQGASARGITGSWESLGNIQPKMLNFLENHDEQRIASPQFLGSASDAYPALAVSLLFNDAAFMLYFGQEVGENASESEDGRTSIFNWCDPAAVSHLFCYIRLGMGLSAAEESVLARYRGLLKYAKIPAFASGRCWDLCYCNVNTAGFNPDRHFAFMRYDEGGSWLVFSNFSSETADVSVAIPAEMQAVCGRTEVNVHVAPHDAAVVSLQAAA